MIEIKYRLGFDRKIQVFVGSWKQFVDTILTPNSGNITIVGDKSVADIVKGMMK